VTGLEVAQEQLKLLFVVVRWLGPRPTVLGPVGGTEAEVVRLDAPVAFAIGAGRSGVNARQQSAGGIARVHVGVDLLDELMVNRVPYLDAVERLAVGAVRFPPDMVGDAGLRQKVALVGRVEEHLAAIRLARLHEESDNPGAILADSLRQVETLTE